MIQLSCGASPTSLAEAALAYARAGLPIFPVQPHSKVPLVTHGVYAATTDEQQIARWWRRCPTANIGMPTGQASGRIVLDVDPRHGGTEALERLQQALDRRAAHLGCASIALIETRVQRTGGGGLHLVFARRTDLATPLRNMVRFAGYPGLDLRGEAGYCVVAPSQHASGGIYTWLNDTPLVSFPDLLLDVLHHYRQQRALARALLTSRPLPERQARLAQRADPAYWLHFVLARTSVGCRHEQALFLAGRLLQEAALSPAQAEVWVCEYARRVPQHDHPFSVEEALGCLSWIASQVA